MVRLSGTNYIKAQANTEANAEAVGIVVSVEGVDDFTIQTSGHITGLSGLTAGSVYYLDDDTAGLLTLTEPPDVGDVSKPLLIADTTTSGWIFNMRGFINSAASLGGSDWDATVVKAADESVTASAVLQNDDELAFAVDASGSYFFEMMLLYDAVAGSGTPDLKHAFTISSGAFSLPWRKHMGITIAGAAQEAMLIDMSTVVTNGTATPRMVYVKGTFTASLAATVTLQWAQNTSDANATRVLAGSFIRYRKLS